MKIAYVTMQFPVASETFAAVELRALRRLGAEVTVLTYRAPPPRAAEMLAERGLADLRVDQGSAGSVLQGLLLAVLKPADAGYLLAMIIRHCWRRPMHLAKALALAPRSLVLLQRIAALRPEVVHLFWGHYPSLLGLLVQRRLPATALSQFLGAYDLEERFAPSARLAQRVRLLLTHAKANLPAIAGLGVDPEQVRISYRGVEVPDPLPGPAKQPGLMVIAERLVPQKRSADALRVFATLRRALPEARLRVLGAGPELQPLKDLAAELELGSSVSFLGHVPHDQALGHLAEAQVLLTMSQSPSERLPNALKEAMLRRCVCLSARSPGIEELIEDGVTGLLVEAGDNEAAARRLASLLADAPAADQMADRAQACVAERFNVDRLMADRLAQWAALRRSGAAEGSG
ncbi:glycosyltransferase family 4 protein [Pelagibius sp.]|uniref:glycosyltransferase family 4 protein n=1 Tax=Pelagibius sp. TaxID=1931238 RepID=UPI00260940F4|nr:glycosyltransferase family 4 protein [Pelagibius sp.]